MIMSRLLLRRVSGLLTTPVYSPHRGADDLMPSGFPVALDSQDPVADDFCSCLFGPAQERIVQSSPRVDGEGLAQFEADRPPVRRDEIRFPNKLGVAILSHEPGITVESLAADSAAAGLLPPA